ncbi:small ribosomal subunit biogenesis GTPase RsgA [Catenovulum sp. SX2]|uniref:small ribosomal subunit biogenesis GTPase RsgA n=1 Tax=Catenovulum TaxID=1172191 RepID=UPI0002EE7C6E|nr:small ribosomal subunit biogenesis GTPase RsgA [Catenovulum agarivorans]
MTKKKKLTKQQLRRMRSNRSRKIEQTRNNPENLSEDCLLGPARHGVVISRYGQQADIENEQGELIRCDMRRTVESIVAGDKVIWHEVQSEGGAQGVIEAVEERESVLTRPDFYDGVKAVAANIEQVVVLSSILPELSWQIIDRYLVAVEQMGAHPVVVINKVDLLDSAKQADIQKIADYYQSIGYPVHLLSVKTQQGFETIAQLLQNKVSIVVGQSGVGKSSLVNKLLPDTNAQTGDVSDVSGLGTHTTTVAKLYHLPTGGDLIDSPGVREFALWHLSAEEIFDGFVEFAQYRGNCKFRDCKHLDDPKCGLKDAVEQGLILASRLENYHKILQSIAENKPAHSKHY